MGCPRRKLIIGMPAFGRSFKLKTPYKHRVSAQAKGPGPAGPFLKEEGRYSYFEVCKQFLYSGGYVMWHREHLVPSVYHDYTWVSYDDAFSLQIKV
ncbi:hypothetical protein NP493_747g01057 [Ridgeia piscesae]|uniref:GH18 domain-containing protein n=1 Tax=Ridgeia piscesae TaxID=27915 RepID=A0AAD9KQW0_RIDPI|nr:hypothetical protein NP493_747g01057 [Ridgeia piscesae]